jgi:hypothetical protein
MVPVLGRCGLSVGQVSLSAGLRSAASQGGMHPSDMRGVRSIVGSCAGASSSAFIWLAYHRVNGWVDGPGLYA